MDLQKYCDNRVMNGYGSLLLYKRHDEPKYHFLIALETVPFVNGSVETFDYDLTSCRSKGKVAGKEDIEDKDVDFMWHRDNIMKLESLVGEVLEFMSIDKEYVARTYTGTIAVRPQDLTGDIAKGTFTITAMYASTYSIYDARDLIMDTIVFANPIASELVIDSADGKKIKLTTDPANNDENTYVSIGASSSEKYKENDEYKDAYTLTPVENSKDEYIIKYVGKEPTKKNYSILSITASPTDTYKEEYASWTTTIALSTDIKASE